RTTAIFKDYLKVRESGISMLQEFIGKNQNPSAVIPAQAGIRSVRFQLFPINSCCFLFLDSHFRGNDGGGDKFLQSKISSFL
ncbi:TPA: hypothetical protein ACKMU7_002128, partial [Neisseria gonorrhoeae]